jgi:26S proteasome regulatory subunit N7
VFLTRPFPSFSISLSRLCHCLLTLDAATSYEEACAELGWSPDAALAASMRAAVAARLSELDAAVEEARENAGDVEVRDALAAKAAYICDTGAVW